MSQAAVLNHPPADVSPSGYVAFDRRWLVLASACALWALAFWQLTGPVAAFLAEADRVRLQLPYGIRLVSELPWWAIAVFGSLAALAVGPRFRSVGNVILIGLPVVANLIIHLGLYTAQAAVVTHMLRAY